MQSPILFADDSEDDEFFFRRALRLSGLANPLIVVRDGDEAIAYLKGDGIYADREKHPLPGVLMLDLKMPRKNGFDVLQWVKQQPELQALLVIVLTNSEHEEDRNRASAMGAQAILPKPCTAADLKTLTEAFPRSWTASQS